MTGALLAIAWYYRKNNNNSLKIEYETSAEKFRYEMQRSADEVIARMNERIDHLEKLVEDADQRSAQLEWQLARLNGGDQYTEQQNTEYEQVQSNVEPQGFSNILEQSLAEEDISAAIGVIQSVRAINAYQSAPTPEVYEEQVEKEEISVPIEDLPSDDNYASFAEKQEQVILAEEDVAVSDNNELKTAMVRQLVREGLETEEIARRVHLGRNAVELIRQMEENSSKR